jgi:hypothetical protein
VGSRAEESGGTDLEAFHTGVGAHTDIRAHTHTYTHTYTQTYTHIHTDMRAHTHTHTHTHTHIHAHADESGEIDLEALHTGVSARSRQAARDLPDRLQQLLAGG